MKAKNYDLWVRMFWIALGVFAAAYSYSLDIGKFINPGPGLFPFLLACVFTILSVMRIFTSLHVTQKNASEAQGPGMPKIKYWRLLVVVASLLGWAIFLESLGFLPATFLLMMILFRAAGSKKWYQSVIWGLITVLVAYLLFTYLGIRFPPGILRPLGLS